MCSPELGKHLPPPECLGPGGVLAKDPDEPVKTAPWDQVSGLLERR